MGFAEGNPFLIHGTGGAVLIGIIILSGLFIFVHYVKKAKEQAQKNIALRYSSHHIVLKDESANFFGKASLRSKQVRGNGILVLTENEIHFFMFIPRKEIMVPLDSIREIELPTSFLRKTKFRPLLKISFDTRQGAPDSAAWLVRDVEKWNIEIKKRIQNQKKRFSQYEPKK